MASCPILSLIASISGSRSSGAACITKGDMKMKSNVGGIDRLARIVLGIVIIGAGIVTGSWLGAIGLVPLVTGAASRCPLYVPFRASTSGSEAGSKGAATER